MRKKWIPVLAGLILCVSLNPFASGGPEADSGEIRGIVFGSDGRVLGGVRVTAHNTATGKAYVSLSDSGGVFLFFHLPAGTYVLSVEADGTTAGPLETVHLGDGEKRMIRIQVFTPGVRDEQKEKNDLSGVIGGVIMPAERAGGIKMGHGDGLRIGRHNTEEYDRIYETGFLHALTNPLSTFSIDVDTASYANVRRFIKQNERPLKDVVRIEEMINYFDYAYPLPKPGKPFSITTEISSCPWNPAHRLIHLGLQGRKPPMDELPASNLVFLIDVSGSMRSSEKLPLLQAAFKLLVDQLGAKDRISIVVYAGAAGVVLPAVSGDRKEDIRTAVDRLQAGGSTAGGEGIRLAYKIAKENFLRGGNNRIILATDGDFNVGVSSTSELVRLVEEKRKEGVYLTVLGFGMGNYKGSRLEQLADKGNGNYHYIDSLLEAKKVFVADMRGTLFTIAKDVKIQVEFNPAKVKAYRLIGYENRVMKNEDFADDGKDAGELGAGHSVTVLYEVVPFGSEEEIAGRDELKYQRVTIDPESISSREIMTVKLRYKPPRAEESRLIVHGLEDVVIEPENTSHAFKFAAAVAEFGLLLRDSEFKADSSFQSVLKLAREGRGADPYGYRSEFIQLVEICRLLDNGS